MAETILAVDDDIDILDLVQMSLTADGFDVVTASNGPDALEQARAHSPDLILLDLMMPGMGGFEVMEKLKADSQTRTIPVIMLTARAQTHEKVQGLNAGADDYITKPFDLKELTARIESVLGRTRPTKYINPLIGAMGDWFTETGIEQLASHLQTATMIQQKLLPQGAPDLPGFDIAGLLRSSMAVSGDFYDFIPLGSEAGRLGVTIADVRGKGIPAALLMVMIRTALRLVCREESSPGSVLKRINDLLAIDTDPELFATMVYGILDSRSMTFTYSNAGHCYPLHLRNVHPPPSTGGNNGLSLVPHPPVHGGEQGDAIGPPRGRGGAGGGGGEQSEESVITPLTVGGMILGSFNFAAFESGTISLDPGDAILLYTDGVTETERESDATFYEERKLAQIFQSSIHLSAEMICRAIETDLLNFIGTTDVGPTHHWNDDLTIVVIKVKP